MLDLSRRSLKSEDGMLGCWKFEIGNWKLDKKEKSFPIFSLEKIGKGEEP